MRVRDRDMLVRYVALMGLSGRGLARRAQLSPAVVNHILAGRRTTCSARTAAALERALDAPPGLLFPPRDALAGQSRGMG